MVGEEFGSSRLSPGGTAVTDLWNVVSLQSTSRPGCIIDLKPIADAVQVMFVWQSLIIVVVVVRGAVVVVMMIF